VFSFDGVVDWSLRPRTGSFPALFVAEAFLPVFYHRLCRASAAAASRCFLPANDARKEGRKEGIDRRKERRGEAYQRRKECMKEASKDGRKEGRKKGTTCSSPDHSQFRP
jgi:hypothetical protein